MEHKLGVQYLLGGFIVAWLELLVELVGEGGLTQMGHDLRLGENWLLGNEAVIRSIFNKVVVKQARSSSRKCGCTDGARRAIYGLTEGTMVVEVDAFSRSGTDTSARPYAMQSFLSCLQMQV